VKSRARHVNVVLACCGILTGFGATFLLWAALHGGDPPARAAPSPAAHARPGQAGRPGPARRRRPAQPSAAALDAQWLDYSDHSTCADWAGGDGVSAIRLSRSQVAWFFSDTYLGPAGPRIGFSHLSGFVHNSVVVQTGTGPAARLVTLTGGGACTGPGDPGAAPGAESVVQPPNPASGQREWDADGISVGSTVVKFYNDYLPGPIPFVPVSTTIASFPVSALSTAGTGPTYGAAAQPALTPVPGYTPPGGGTPIVWGSAVLRAGPGGRTVYVYGWQSPDPASPVRELYLARVGAARLADFGAWQFYAAGQWTDRQDLAQPLEPAGQDGNGNGNGNVPSGFSVIAAGGRYWLIEAAGTGTPDIDAYPGPAPWGPFDWSGGILLYRAPGIGLTKADDYRVMYEARAEPALSTPQQLVISYNVNSEAVTAACASISRFTNAMTQPRFVTVPMSVFGPPGARHGHALGAAPHYPAITQQQPGQWFSAWSYQGGCPPVPGVSGATGQPGPGSVTLSWLSAGLAVRYRVLERGASGSYLPVRTVASPRARITGLTPGATYQFEIVPLNIYEDPGPATFLSVKDS
jgi:hypothetical protein